MLYFDNIVDFVDFLDLTNSHFYTLWKDYNFMVYVFCDFSFLNFVEFL